MQHEKQHNVDPAVLDRQSTNTHAPLAVPVLSAGSAETRTAGRAFQRAVERAYGLRAVWAAVRRDRMIDRRIRDLAAAALAEAMPAELEKGLLLLFAFVFVQVAEIAEAVIARAAVEGEAEMAEAAVAKVQALLAMLHPVSTDPCPVPLDTSRPCRVHLVRAVQRLRATRVFRNPNVRGSDVRINGGVGTSSTSSGCGPTTRRAGPPNLDSPPARLLVDANGPVRSTMPGVRVELMVAVVLPDVDCMSAGRRVAVCE